MRKPSSINVLFAHWLSQVVPGQGIPTERLADGEPYCGFFQFREVSGGPWVPLRIFCEREIDDMGDLACDEILMAQVRDGTPFPAEKIMGRLPRAITRERYDALMADDSPQMQATKARVDLTTKPPRP